MRPPSSSQVLGDYLDDTAPAPPTAPVTSNMHPPTVSRGWRARLGGPFLAPPTGPAAGPPAPRAKSARPQEHPELTAAREQARDDAARLRAAGLLTDHERRELLADLASRLGALVVKLTTANVPLSAFLPLWQLAAALKDADAGGPAWDEALWDQALRVLDDFAAGSALAERKGRAFWKRS